MKKIKIFAVLLLMPILFSGCAMKEAFTNSIVTNYSLTDASLKQVQFYTSQTIVLESSNSSSSVYVDQGKLISNKNSKNYNVVIEPQTKCIFEKKAEDGAIYVRFEEGKYKYLKFKTRPNDPSGRYYLAIDRYEGNRGVVTYDNHIYYVSSYGANSYLLVSVRRIQQSFGRTRTVRGMKVY